MPMLKHQHPLIQGLTPACWAVALCCGVALSPAWAGDRLLATWGVNQVEGAGGGLTPWATITGTGSSDQVGGTAYATQARTQDGHHLRVAGAAVGFYNRVELSLSRWSFKVSEQVLPDKTLEMSTLGVKIRVLGDAVYDQASWLPQVSVGAQYKWADDSGLFKLLGARADEDVDLYASATKLWLGALAGHNVLGNVTLRYTRANQFGLLGFGGSAHHDKALMLEGSLGVMLRDDLVLGTEWRAKPDNISVPGFEEENAHDLFLAWFPSRHLSLTAAWLNLGNIATKKDQKGWYLSGQLAF